MIGVMISIALVNEHNDRIEVMLCGYNSVELNEKTIIHHHYIQIVN
jgi:hypothetical protein